MLSLQVRATRCDKLDSEVGDLIAVVEIQREASPSHFKSSRVDVNSSHHLEPAAMAFFFSSVSINFSALHHCLFALFLIQRTTTCLKKKTVVNSNYLHIIRGL